MSRLLGVSQTGAPVAQLDRAAVYGTAGYRFEPYRVYFKDSQASRLRVFFYASTVLQDPVTFFVKMFDLQLHSSKIQSSEVSSEVSPDAQENGMSMPTMQDIADRAGVHRATVSNVLNGKFKAERSDAYRRAEYIRQIAEEMGYRPSVAARATRTGRTGFIGMVRSPSLSNSVHIPDFESGLDEALHQRALCLVRDIIEDNVVEAPRIVRENAVDGLLINYAMRTPLPIQELLERCQVPAIWINRKREHNCVYPNDEGAAYTATKYVIENGHRNIVYVDMAEPVRGDIAINHYSTVDRLAGYQRAMCDAGLSPHIFHLQYTRKNNETNYNIYLKSCISFLKSSHRGTAVVSNVDGRTMLHAAMHVGLKVPDDLSLIAFDNHAGMDEYIAFDRLLVPARSMGHAAVDEICNLIESPDMKRKPVVLPFEFHQTGTVGPLCQA